MRSMHENHPTELARPAGPTPSHQLHPNSYSVSHSPRRIQSATNNLTITSLRNSDTQPAGRSQTTNAEYLFATDPEAQHLWLPARSENAQLSRSPRGQGNTPHHVATNSSRPRHVSGPCFPPTTFTLCSSKQPTINACAAACTKQLDWNAKQSFRALLHYISAASI